MTKLQEEHVRVLNRERSVIRVLSDDGIDVVDDDETLRSEKDFKKDTSAFKEREEDLKEEEEHDKKDLSNEEHISEILEKENHLQTHLKEEMKRSVFKEQEKDLKQREHEEEEEKKKIEFPDHQFNDRKIFRKEDETRCVEREIVEKRYSTKNC